MTNILNVFMPEILMAANGNGNSNSNGASGLLFSILPFVIIIVFFYFILIRPQRKKDKESQQMRSNIQIGDEIMTIGGIVGFVVRKNEDTVVIETGGDKSKLRIKMWAVQENLTVHENEAKAKEAMASAKKNKNSKKDEDESASN